ncbi:hypothetical protein ACFVMC_28210 [Nocardia sp. NPDC127579]|uniref:hypothetical protein n=1 Tax=Nocardia sp. NPDC127579 TaxID=3345402 RepID=UPI0036439D99
MSVAARAVQAEVRVVHRDGLNSTAEVSIARTEQVFAGHYPDFAIFPGVCTIELVARSAEQALPEPGLTLGAIASTRFLHPIYPGDEVSITNVWKREDQDWVLRSVVSSGENVCVRARLRYPISGADEVR